MQHRKRLLKANRKPLDSFDEALPTQSNPSDLINNIQNQNLYLKLVGIALQLSREAGVSQQSLQEVQNKLLGVKGFQEYSMLNQEQIKEIDKVDSQNKKSPYVLSKKYITPLEQISFLTRIQKEVQQVQTKQHVIFALKKYIEQKKKSILDTVSKAENFTRTKFFLQKTQYKLNNKKLQRSNFYGQTLRQIFGRISPQKSVAYEIMKRMVQLKTVWGHTFFSESEQQYCPVYNTIFDNTQKLIISGGDDGKIKVWSLDTGGLISTLQGHKDYINKICVSKDNKILLSAAQDGVRFFDLDNMNSMGGYKIESILDIGEVIQNSTKDSYVIFANHEKLFVLPLQTITTQRNRKIQLYDFKVYNFGSRLNQRIINMNTLTINPQGIVFLGFVQGQIIIFDFNKLSSAQIDQNNYGVVQGMQKLPQFVLPIISVLNAHQSDILEIKWNPVLSYFSSGAKKDGVCKIWQFKTDEPDRKPVVIKELKIPKYKMKRKKKQYSCNFSIWNSSYTHITCSFAQHQNQQQQSQNRGDGEVIVYNTNRMEITWEMSKTLDLSSIRAMDNHPYLPNIMVVCDSFGKVIIGDIYQNYIINILQERAFHLNHPSFCLVPSDCRFSQDGMNLLVATEYGNFSIYGYDLKEFYKVYPTQQLFQNDYEQFHVDPNTYKPVIDVNAPIDVNNLNRGEIQNMRHQPYKNIIKIDQKKYKKLIQSKVSKQQHLNSYQIQLHEVQRINQCYQDYDRNMQIFKQNIEQMESKRMALLYEQAETRQTKLKQIINEKLQKIKEVDQNISVGLLTNSFSSQNFSGFSQIQATQNTNQNIGNIVRRRGRRPIRNLGNNNNTRTNYRSFQQQSQEQELNNRRQLHHNGIHHEEQEEYQIQGSQQQQQDDGQSQDEDEQFNQQNQSEEVYPNSRARRRRRLSRNRTYQNYDHLTRPIRNTRRRPPNVEIEQLQHDFQQQYSRLRKRKHQQDQQNVEIQEGLQNKQQQSRKQMRKVISRSLAQMRVEKQECHLCHFKQATVTCRQCHSKSYCDTCRNYRGKRFNQNTRFVCFQCYYNKNSSPQLHKNISFQKYNMKQRTDLFIPQIGDEVAYFFQGYQQFLYDKIQILNNKYIQLGIIFDIIPHQNQPQLINIQKCTIIDINYAFPLQQQSQLSYRNNSYNNRGRGRLIKSNIQDIITLITIKTITGIQFRVFYCPGYQYLLKWQIYDDIMKNDRYAKFKLFDIVKIKDQEIQIQQIRPLNQTYNNSIWKNIIVHKAQNKYLRRSRDKNDDIPINIWNIDGFIDARAFVYQTSMTTHMRQHYTEQILKIKQKQDKLWQIFSQPVNTLQYTTYNQYVEVSMYLQLILQRLGNNYYASQKSFIKDVKMLVQNSISFNTKQSQVTQWAQYLVKLILQGQNVNNNNNNNIHNTNANQYDSTQKKSKSKRKLGSGNGNNNNNNNNKDNQQLQKNKKKVQIKVSKFEQQSPLPVIKKSKRIKNIEQDDDQQDYKGSSQQNYDEEQDSSDMRKRRTRTRRNQSKYNKKQVNQNKRMTRSRTKN